MSRIAVLGKKFKAKTYNPDQSPVDPEGANTRLNNCRKIAKS